jgi:protein-disulfide isomerase
MSKEEITKTADINNKSTLNKYMLPGSVIIAGIIIALAIFISNRNTSSPSNNVNSSNTNTNSSSSSTLPQPNNVNGNNTSGDTNATATVSLGTNPVLGNTKTAKIGIVEFGDFQCPYCKDFYNSVFSSLQSGYINTGDIVYSFRDYPLTTIHPLALGMAQESRCFAEQGKFWQFVNKMYNTNQDTNTPSVVSGYAKNMGLNMNTYQSCIQNSTFQSDIQKDINAGNRIGIQGTPTFIIGKYSNGKVTGQVVLGSRALSYYESIISQY